MNRRTAPLTLLALAAGLLPAVATPQRPLLIGDPAPRIQVAKWLKGTPVKSFRRGKTYVVEFWATWCGPCRTMIPHMTTLARKYRKVTFVGVDVFEQDPADIASVAAFVKSMGAQMQYRVAADGPRGTMAKTWMNAARQTGVPTAFVVGPKGTILWLGHPLLLDDILQQVASVKQAAHAKHRHAARRKGAPSTWGHAAGTAKKHHKRGG